MNILLLRQFARGVYFLLAVSVYVVTVGGFYILITQTENLSLWGAMLCTAPVIILGLLLMSVVLQSMQGVAQQEIRSRVHDFCQWYCRACEALGLLRALRAMCLWLLRIHILSAGLLLCFIPMYCLFNVDTDCLYVCIVLLLYVLIMLCCALLSKRTLEQ